MSSDASFKSHQPVAVGGAARLNGWSFDRALGRSLIRHYRWWAVAVLILMAGNVFLGLGRARIDDSDEARYGVSAFEMLSTRQWVVPTYAGVAETWNLKPPLGYWIEAWSFRLLGPTPWALRMPSALCGLAAVGFTMALARRWLGRRQALLAGAVLATTFGFVSHHGARNGDLDAALTVLVMLVMVQLIGLRRALWRPALLGVTLGAIFLLKSFAVLPILVVALAFFAVARGDRPRLSSLAVALLPLLLTAAGWALARAHADGGTWFLRQMVREDLIERSTRYIDKGTSSALGYLPTLLDRFAPWTLIAAPVAGVAWRRRRRPWRPREEMALLLLWTSVPFLLFSAARTQHHWYLDPIYPGCAMLAAAAVVHLLHLTPRRHRSLVFVGVVALPLLLCEARLAYRVLWRGRMPAGQRFLASLGGYRRGPVDRLRTSFPLRHSERFLLEVVDGFDIVEADASAVLPARLAPLGSSSPAEIARWLTPGADSAQHPCGEVVAEGGGYLLCADSGGGAPSLTLFEEPPRWNRCGSAG